MATYYGCEAWTGSESVGGLTGGVYTGTPNYASSPYSLVTADYDGDGDGVENEAELTAALAAATSGEVIWIKAGVTITITTAYGKQAAAGVIIASNRGVAGAAGGKIKWTHAAYTYMTALLLLNSDCIVIGVQLEGPGPFSASGSGMTNIALKGVSGAKRINIINCDIWNFSMMDIYFNGGNMPYDDTTDWHVIQYSYIHGAQRHGFGYGVAAEGCASYIIEQCILRDNRHHTMAQAYYMTSTYQNNYVCRYCNIGDAWYGNDGSSTDLLEQHQCDVHGSGTDLGDTYAAGGYIRINNNTFTANNTYETKVNVGIRGKPKYGCIVTANWTKKTTRSSPPSYDETVVNGAFTLLRVGGTALPSGTVLATYNMSVYDNWYGATGSPDTEPTVSTGVATGIGSGEAILNGTVTSLGDATEVVVCFDWGLTTAYGNSTTQVVRGLGAFSAAISGLEADTLYHFRAKCVWDINIYGADDDFTTLAAGTPPTVSTAAATSVEQTTATLNGDLTDLGTADPVNVYFQYGIDTSYGYTTTAQSKGATGVFDAALTSLTAGTTYHFRAVAAGDGLGYGSDLTFETEPGAPVVPTCLALAATFIGADAAQLNASMTGLSADAKAIRRKFLWGTATGVYTEEWSEEGEWTTDVSFSHVVTGLMAQETYYVSARMDLA